MFFRNVRSLQVKQQSANQSYLYRCIFFQDRDALLDEAKKVNLLSFFCRRRFLML